MSMYRVRTALSGPAVVGPSVATHYFDVAGGATPQQTADAVAAFWGDLAGAMGPDLTWTTEAVVSQLNEATGALVSLSPTSPASGSGAGGAGDYLPRASQGLLRLHTGQIVNGRELRGHLFVPGPNELMNEDGQPTAAYQTAIIDAGDALVAEALTTWVVWSRPFAGSETQDPRVGSMQPVTFTDAWNQWATLRSRRD